MYVGLLVTGALALTGLSAVVAPTLVNWLAGTGLRHSVPLVAWLVLAVPVPLGGLTGLALGRRVGADLDAAGVWAVPAALGASAPWRRVADIHVERRGGRTVVAFALDDGSMLRLRAPYDGPLLGRDPEFERKQFRIRHLWEAHRYG